MNHGGAVRTWPGWLSGAVVALLVAGLWWSAGTAHAQPADVGYVVDLPGQMLTGVPTDVEVTTPGDVAEDATVQLEVNGETQDLQFEDGVAVGEVIADSGEPTIRVIEDGSAVDFSTSPDGSDPAGEATTGTIPGWRSLLPPFVAIVIALVFRQVIPALLVGVWIGAWGTYGFSIRGMWDGLLDVPNVWVLDALAPPDGDSSHMAIVVFTMLIGGLVGIISRNGGTAGIVRTVTAWASDRKRGQIATSVLGMVIFFDDYANTLVIGNALRPVTDRLQISREKLAYIVDSTAAPVGFGTPWWVSLPVSAVALVALLVWVGRPVPEPSPEQAAPAAAAAA
jgi:hypothetical protein